MRPRAQLGSDGERLVAERLIEAGFEIIGCNVRVGRLELDLIAQRGDLTVFCEVRTRASRAFLDPIDTVDGRKQQRVRAAAAAWLARHGVDGQVRFDAASVILSDDERSLTYYEDAF